MRRSWVVVTVRRRRLPRWLREAVRRTQRAAREDQLPIVVLGAADTGRCVLLALTDFSAWFGTVPLPVPTGEGAEASDGTIGADR